MQHPRHRADGRGKLHARHGGFGQQLRHDDLRDHDHGADPDRDLLALRGYTWQRLHDHDMPCRDHGSDHRCHVHASGCRCRQQLDGDNLRDRQRCGCRRGDLYPFRPERDRSGRDLQHRDDRPDACGDLHTRGSEFGKRLCHDDL